MKKKLFCVILIALLVISAAALIIFRQKTNSNTESGDTDSGIESANFDIQYSDRLVGVPVTSTESNSSTIEVKYGDAGYTRKTLGVSDNSDRRNDLTEESSQTVGVYEVTLKGKDGKLYLATWTYNSFAYTISISDSYDGVDLNEMTEYIMATR